VRAICLAIQQDGKYYDAHDGIYEYRKEVTNSGKCRIMTRRCGIPKEATLTPSIVATVSLDMVLSLGSLFDLVGDLLGQSVCG